MHQQIARYAGLLNIETSCAPQEPPALQLAIERLPVPICVQVAERPNPLLGKTMQLAVAQFVIDLALTANLVRTFVERSRDIATCWGVAVEVRDAPTTMINMDPRAEYHASLRMTLPGRAVDLETFAWTVNQMVCAYVDLMGMRTQRA